MTRVGIELLGQLKMPAPTLARCGHAVDWIIGANTFSEFVLSSFPFPCTRILLYIGMLTFLANCWYTMSLSFARYLIFWVLRSRLVWNQDDQSSLLAPTGTFKVVPSHCISLTATKPSWRNSTQFTQLLQLTKIKPTQIQSIPASPDIPVCHSCKAGNVYLSTGLSVTDFVFFLCRQMFFIKKRCHLYGFVSVPQIVF